MDITLINNSGYWPGKMQSEYAPQLDSIRAVAVLAVFLHHFSSSLNWLREYEIGPAGVRLFFVLSGFLITRILLGLKTAREERRGDTTFAACIKSFYARRFLRLSPVYYTVLLISYFFVSPVHNHLLAFLIYLQNFLFAEIPETFRSSVAPLWSLAIEEQFYAFWPLVILLTRRKYLCVVLFAFVAIGPIFRFCMLALIDLTAFQTSMLLPSHFDTLALGGVGAYLGHTDYGNRHLAMKVYRCALSLGIPITVLFYGLKHFEIKPGYQLLVQELGWGLLFYCVVARLAWNCPSYFRIVLLNPVLIYLGKISYGLYIYHGFMPGIFEWANFSLPYNEDIRFLIFTSATILLSSLSWYTLERTTLRFKQYFPYPR